MRKFDVTMKWVEGDNKYHMIVTRTGGMIQEAPEDIKDDELKQYNCHFLPWAYEGINKKEDLEYEITITPKRRKNEMSDKVEAAKKGRLNSIYTMEVVNEEGIKTIEGKVIVRDQSFAGASTQLGGVLNGLMTPAQPPEERERIG